MTHINFFILDVEGAEMSILSSVDFSLVIFDVLCIETQYSAAKNDEMKSFLAARSVSICVCARVHLYMYTHKNECAQMNV